MSNNAQKGFTLVELSIVIVIIALIVAGVTAGQSLVKQAQLRSVVTEQEQIRVALNAFKLEYDGIPGDLSSAASYWPNPTTDGCNAAGTGANVNADCAGDGNGQILLAAGNTGETYMAWKHLELANLYPGSFVPGAVTEGVIGTNIPASKFTPAGITLVYDDATSDATAGDGAGSGGRDAAKNIIMFGGQAPGTGGTEIANVTVFSINHAQATDNKVDDGAPITGTVIAVGVAGTAATNCIDTATTPDSYNLDTTDATPCGIAFTL